MVAALRVLVADDHRPTLRMLAAVFDGAEGFALVASASDADSAIASAAEHRPDVALVDVQMPGGGGVRATREIRLVSPGTLVVAHSGYSDRELIVDMFRVGAVSYLLKGEITGPGILEALRGIADGRIMLPPTVATHVVGELAVRFEREQREESDLRERERRVRRILDQHEIRTVYQPVLDLRERAVVGVEALTRFSARPRRTPDVWFAEAASVGLGVELELLAIRRALAGAASAPADTYVAVNASPATITDPRLRSLLLGRVPDRTVLEVTEHAPIESYERFNRALEPLRAAGVRVAIDDAGAGFASLRHILRVNPDFIKLDVSLTRRIHEDRTRQALAKALISFAGETDASVVAEGIEHDEELASLVGFGVTYGQGYLLGRPGPLDEALSPATLGMPA